MSIAEGKENMAIAVCCSAKIPSNNTPKLHKQEKQVATLTGKSGANIASRRDFILSSNATVFAVAAAALGEANDYNTPFLQKYRKKSEENKAKNDKERLDSYYKRNYKDYFEYFEGSLKSKEEQQLSETEKGILTWLQKNK